MATVSDEAIYRLAVAMQADLAALKLEARESLSEAKALRGHMSAIRTDIAEIGIRLARSESRLGHIGARLDRATIPAGPTNGTREQPHAV